MARIRYRTFLSLQTLQPALTVISQIPDHDENKKINGFSVVVSNAGDWTKRHIQNPPKKLWIRGYPLHGLLYTSKLFKKIVLVATGSGIGPCLSLIYSNQVNCRILWSTPNPETVFGKGRFS